MWWSEGRRRPVPSGARAVAAAAILLALVPAGCGFEPLYGEGSPAAGLYGRIAVEPPEGAAGFDLRERLTERLGDGENAAWRLSVDLEIDVTGAALTQENATTRLDVTGRADIALRPLAGGPPVFVDRVRATTSFSAPVSETSSAFASEIARQDAERRVARTLADKIVLRLAVAADQLAPPAASSPVAAAGAPR